MLVEWLEETEEYVQKWLGQMLAFHRLQIFIYIVAHVQCWNQLVRPWKSNWPIVIGGGQTDKDLKLGPEVREFKFSPPSVVPRFGNLSMFFPP